MGFDVSHTLKTTVNGPVMDFLGLNVALYHHISLLAVYTRLYTTYTIPFVIEESDIKSARRSYDFIYRCGTGRSGVVDVER